MEPPIYTISLLLRDHANVPRGWFDQSADRVPPRNGDHRPIYDTIIHSFVINVGFITFNTSGGVTGKTQSIEV
jgi:hypothetical protein